MYVELPKLCLQTHVKYTNVHEHTHTIRSYVQRKNPKKCETVFRKDNILTYHYIVGNEPVK